MSSIYIQGGPVYTNMRAGTVQSDLQPDLSKYQSRGPLPPFVEPVNFSDVCADLAGPTCEAPIVAPRVEDEAAVTFAAFSVVPSGEFDLSAARTSTDVPEPGLLVLFAIGAAGVARRLRRG